MIKVKLNILGVRPGTVVKKGHKHYNSFKNWADKKSRRNGALICEEIDTGKFNRAAAVERLNELEVEFKGNISNADLEVLLKKSNEEAAAKAAEEADAGTGKGGTGDPAGGDEGTGDPAVKTEEKKDVKAAPKKTTTKKKPSGTKKKDAAKGAKK